MEGALSDEVGMEEDYDGGLDESGGWDEAKGGAEAEGNGDEDDGKGIEAEYEDGGDAGLAGDADDAEGSEDDVAADDVGGRSRSGSGVDDDAADVAAGTEGWDGGADEAVAAASALIDAINSARVAAALPPLVEHTGVASAVQAHANAMAVAGFSSPFDLSGQQPYQRAFFSGCFAHVSEHLFSVSGGDLSRDTMVELCRDVLDGDKRYAADLYTPYHTHVAVGVAVGSEDRTLRVVVDFVDELVAVTMQPAPAGQPEHLLTSEESYIIVRSLVEGEDVVACSVYYEPSPTPLTAEEADALKVYDDFAEEKAAVIWPWDMERLQDGSLKVPIYLTALRAGHYYTQILVRGDVDSVPYAPSPPSDDFDIAAPSVHPGGAVVFTVTPAAAAAAGAVDIEAVAEEDEAATLEESVGHFSEVAVVAATELTPPGFKRQLLFGAREPVGAPSGEDRRRGVALCTAYTVARRPIVEMTLVSGTDEASTRVPAGWDVASENLMPLVVAEAVSLGASGTAPSSPGCVVLAVRRSAEDVPASALYDAGLDLVAEGVVPTPVPVGYSARQRVPVSVGPWSAHMSLCVCSDSRAVGAFLAGSVDPAVAAARAGKPAAEEYASVGSLTDEDDEFADEERAAADDGPAALAARRRDEVARLQSLIDAAVTERETLSAKNAALQKRLAFFLAARGAEEKDDKPAAGVSAAANAEKEKRYLEQLAAVVKAREELRTLQSQVDATAMELQERLDEKEERATEIAESFAEFKREIARAAENSRTGKPIPARIIGQFEATESAKDGEVEKVRLKHIHLRAQLRKQEAKLKRKDELSVGLHLIDFEQLKIENQTLNEKIEERQEELHKLRRKTQNSVLVLSHVREKLTFVQAQVAALREELASIEAQVASGRDALSKAKRARDGLRTENEKAKQQQGFLASTLLVKDYEARKRRIEELRAQVATQKERHGFLTTSVL